METDNVIENSRQKLTKKNCDMICANSLRKAGSGFGTDTNIITMITKAQTMSVEMLNSKAQKFKALTILSLKRMSALVQLH